MNVESEKTQAKAKTLAKQGKGKAKEGKDVEEGRMGCVKSMSRVTAKVSEVMVMMTMIIKRPQNLLLKSWEQM
jgi:hypothetical protein